MNKENLRTMFWDKDLYALQDGVFQIMENQNFYLTGGTALSRFYLDHRYSDDLDFFVHQNQDFLSPIQEIIAKLKVDFVNERECNFGRISWKKSYSSILHENHSFSFPRS